MFCKVWKKERDFLTISCKKSVRLSKNLTNKQEIREDKECWYFASRCGKWGSSEKKTGDQPVFRRKTAEFAGYSMAVQQGRKQGPSTIERQMGPGERMPGRLLPPAERVGPEAVRRGVKSAQRIGGKGKGPQPKVGRGPFLGGIGLRERVTEVRCRPGWRSAAPAPGQRRPGCGGAG